jgi:hypothetical protein
VALSRDFPLFLSVGSKVGSELSWTEGMLPILVFSQLSLCRSRRASFRPNLPHVSCKSKIKWFSTAVGRQYVSCPPALILTSHCSHFDRKTAYAEGAPAGKRGGYKEPKALQ